MYADKSCTAIFFIVTVLIIKVNVISIFKGFSLPLPELTFVFIFKQKLFRLRRMIFAATFESAGYGVSNIVFGDIAGEKLYRTHPKQ